MSALQVSAKWQLWTLDAVRRNASVDVGALARAADFLGHAINGHIINEAVLTIDNPHVRGLVPSTGVVTSSLARTRWLEWTWMAATRKLVILS